MSASEIGHSSSLVPWAIPPRLLESGYAPKPVLENIWGRSLVWGSVVLITVVIAIITLTDSVALDEWPSIRDLTEPMILSHLIALIPICLAIRNSMPLTAGFLVAATIASFFYHLFMETSTNDTLVHLDVFLATSTAVLTGLILVVSLTFSHTSYHAVAVSIVLSILALFTYTYPNLSHHAVDSTIKDKLHPLWHILAFLSTAVVIWNFRRNPSYTQFSRNPWVYKIQTFSW
jgi:hypothetical protein